MCYENLECWRLMVGFSLLFVVPSVVFFWKLLIDFERKKKKEGKGE